MGILETLGLKKKRSRGADWEDDQSRSARDPAIDLEARVWQRRDVDQGSSKPTSGASTGTRSPSARTCLSQT